MTGTIKNPMSKIATSGVDMMDVNPLPEVTAHPALTASGG
jgi:hypothetical protein